MFWDDLQLIQQYRAAAELCDERELWVEYASERRKALRRYREARP
jgi:hypothetical protein